MNSTRLTLNVSSGIRPSSLPYCCTSDQIVNGESSDISNKNSVGIAARRAGFTYMMKKHLTLLWFESKTPGGRGGFFILMYSTTIFWPWSNMTGRHSSHDVKAHIRKQILCRQMSPSCATKMNKASECTEYMVAFSSLEVLQIFTLLDAIRTSHEVRARQSCWKDPQNERGD